MKSPFTLISIVLIACTSHTTFAQQQDAEPEKKSPAIRFLIAGGAEFGGDEIAKVYFTNSDAQSVNAGQGIYGAIGLEYTLPKVERLRFRGSVGYKYVTTKADNAHIRLTRVPVHLTANWFAGEKQRFRLGAGLVMHRAIKFNADGIGDNITFKNANGAIFELAYYGIGISYTTMKYDDKKNNTYSANSFGITLSGVLPRRNK